MLASVFFNILRKIVFREKMLKNTNMTCRFIRMTVRLYTIDREKPVDKYVETVDLSTENRWKKLST